MARRGGGGAGAPALAAAHAAAKEAEGPGQQLASVSTRYEVVQSGGSRARSHCCFAPPLIRFIPDSLTYSVPLFLKRQCDRTLGGSERHEAPDDGDGGDRAAERQTLVGSGIDSAAAAGLAALLPELPELPTLQVNRGRVFH
jgi:hypothetical protein